MSDELLVASPTRRGFATCLLHGRSIGMRVLIAGVVAAGWGMIGFATETMAADPSPINDPSRKFFEQYCHACHAGAEPEGEFRVDTLSPDFDDKANRTKWQKVLEQLNAGTMPPPGKPRPAAKEADALAAWIDGQVEAAETARQATQGRAVMRRLNQVEYQNTVRDLLGVNVDLKDILPVDLSPGGFDTTAETLHMSSYQLNGYLAAANRVLEAALAGGPRPNQVKRRIDVKNEAATRRYDVYRHLDDGVAIFSSDLASNIQIVLWNFLTRDPGRYRFRISAYAYQSEKPVIFHVNGGTNNLGDPPYLIGYFEAPPGEPTVIEFEEQMEAGRNIRLLVDTGVRPRDLLRLGGGANYQGPGLVVQWVEMEGPLGDGWPPRSYRLLFGDMPQAPVPGNPDRREVVSEQPLADAEAILRRFTRRAFRRAVTDDDIRPFVDRVRAKLDEDYSFEQALRVGLKSVLVSPDFLFLRESIRPAGDLASTGGLAQSPALDEFALASRLSYFLWSSMPDEDLLQLAEQGKLSRPDMLRAQVERMLHDPRAKAFTENFAGQWLGLREIDATAPDRQLYPEYDPLLRSSMTKEVYLFFDEVLKNDLSLTNFVSSDFSVLDERLAAHYGIPGVQGLAFRKVSLPPDSHRGGVLTMAAVLKVTANGTTTSPVVRGSWVLDRILGTPPARPPADVEAVEPDIRGATTIRDQLARHRQVATCAVCHVSIDPPGFALENFDVIGGWREHYRSIGEGTPVSVSGRRMPYKHGPLVDAGDVLPDGRVFRNIDEYKQLLLSDRDQLARALAVKLLTYATGVPPTVADRANIEAIVGAARDKEYGFRSLIHELVQSEVFLSK
jgi:mono/diheme cytochrome c family protein